MGGFADLAKKEEGGGFALDKKGGGIDSPWGKF